MTTKQSEHTAGPWTVIPDGIVDTHWGKARRVFIAAPALLTQPGQAVDDAHLIAAAPELLEALEALMAWSDHTDLTGLPADAPVAASAPSFDETCTMVHRAIAKAKGLEASASVRTK